MTQKTLHKGISRTFLYDRYYVFYIHTILFYSSNNMASMSHVFLHGFPQHPHVYPVWRQCKRVTTWLIADKFNAPKAVCGQRTWMPVAGPKEHPYSEVINISTSSIWYQYFSETVSSWVFRNMISLYLQQKNGPCANPWLILCMILEPCTVGGWLLQTLQTTWLAALHYKHYV